VAVSGTSWKHLMRTVLGGTGLCFGAAVGALGLAGGLGREKMNSSQLRELGMEINFPCCAQAFLPVCTKKLRPRGGIK
jgi:hypothetical protein